MQLILGPHWLTNGCDQTIDRQPIIETNGEQGISQTDIKRQTYINSLAQDCGNSSASAMESQYSLALSH